MMTGMRPPGGVGARMPGSTSFGGQRTPFDCASFWLRLLPSGFATSASPRWPVVAEGKALEQSRDCMGFVAAADGGLFAGGACAAANVGNTAMQANIVQLKRTAILVYPGSIICCWIFVTS